MRLLFRFLFLRLKSLSHPLLMCQVLQFPLHTSGLHQPFFNISMYFFYWLVWIVILFSNTVLQTPNKGKCWIPSALLYTPECSYLIFATRIHKCFTCCSQRSPKIFPTKLRSSWSVPGLNCCSTVAGLYEIPVNSFCQPVKVFLNAFLKIWCRLLSGNRYCTSHLNISISSRSWVNGWTHFYLNSLLLESDNQVT